MTAQRNDKAQARLTDGSREETTRQLTDEELLNVSGGTQCASGAHDKGVTLMIRKSGGTQL